MNLQYTTYTESFNAADLNLLSEHIGPLPQGYVPGRHHQQTNTWLAWSPSVFYTV